MINPRGVKPTMALNLAPSMHELIYDMIHSGELFIIEIAQAAGCNKSTIRIFGSVKAQPIKGGRTRNITPVMVEALCDHLIEKRKACSIFGRIRTSSNENEHQSRL